MTLEWKDMVLLAIGGALGVPASMTASLLLGPGVTILCGFSIVKILGKLRRRICSDALFDASWEQKWRVESDAFPPENRSELQIYRFLHLLAAEAEQTTADGVPYRFRILAVIDRNIITGKWMDPLETGYYGAFQMLLSHTHDKAVGTWIGFSSKGLIKAGDWAWAKRSRQSSN